MKHAFSIALTLLMAGTALGREARLVRYPHYHGGKVTFSYLGDIWVANEDGSNVQRLTVHKGRDYNSRFSPDGKWIAFSSDRNGNLDVWVMPAGGGHARQVTTHSADDVTLNWTPDSKGVLFASTRAGDFLNKLYVAPIGGGMPREAGPDYGLTGSFSPDGKKLVVNRKGQQYWRKFYRGAYQTDVTVMDLDSKTFTDLTDFAGLDSWPLYGSDGSVYFVSDRDGNGLTNLWKVSERGNHPEKVTTFTSGDVRFPTISGDGKTVVFEHDFGVWKLDVASKAVKPLKFDIAAETQEALVEWRDFNSQVDDFDAAPDGKRIAFSIHGQIFTAPVDEGDLVQITESPDRDRNPDYSPDGKLLAYVSDKDGREEIYVIPVDGTAPAKKITSIDALKRGYEWSPDSKWLLISTNDGRLLKAEASGKETKELASSKYGGIDSARWSPDGKFVVYAKADVTRSDDIYMIPADGGEEKKLTFDFADDTNPRFSADARKVYFVRREGDFGEGQRPTAQVFVIPLEKLDRDPLEPAPGEASEGGGRPGGGGGPGRGPAASVTPAKDVKIDWAGLKRRTRRVTPANLSAFNYIPANDGKTIVFVGSEGGGGRFGGGGGGATALYSIGDDGKRLTRIASGNAPTEAPGEDAPRGPRRGFGGGISGLALTKDGRTIFYQEGDGVYSTAMGGTPVAGADAPAGGRGLGRGGAGGGGPVAVAAAGGGGGGSSKKVTFVAKVKVDHPAEWAEMFGDAWRTMKYRFYDPKMHGVDWEAARAKYAPLVEYVGDAHELVNVINEMIGELNASHTGATARSGRGPGDSGISTGHLGFDLVTDNAAGRYKVGHIYETGPADADWIKVEKGNYLVALNGRPVKSGDDYHDLLNRRLNKKVAVTLNVKPTPEGAWTVKIDPVSPAAFADLNYKRWVDERRAIADRLSGGKVGYVHIKAMDQPSLAKFRRELNEFRHKDALVIDQRFNGGGNIEQELLALLVQRQYQVWHPRGTEATTRPLTGFFGPKIVLQNWRSASNAEMFPAGFRALGLGKVVGTPTMGAVIGTGSYSLIDGSTIRTPAVGVYLNDESRTNMENTGVKPDIFVDNTPEDNLAGRDRQLEVAVKELLKELRPASGVAGE
jgi:tricorn protease